MENVLREFRDAFRRNADRTALIDHASGRVLTYRELEDLSSRLAARLSPHVTPGGRVAFLYANGLEIAVAYLACYQLGCTSVPINPEFHDKEVRHMLAFAKPDVLVTTRGVSERFSLPRLTLAMFGPHAKDELSLDSLKTHDRLSKDLFPGLKEGQVAHIFFSSGSTGVPKAIPARFERYLGQARAFAQAFSDDETARFYNVLPLAYAASWYFVVVSAFAGGSGVVDQPFGAAVMYRYWETVRKHGINRLFFTPSMLAALIAVGIEDPEAVAEVRKNLGWSLVGLAPLTVDLKMKFEAMFGLRTQKIYGIVEVLFCSTWMNRLDLPEASVGRPLPGNEVVVCDAKGQPVPVGTDGEIRIRSPWMSDGYWNQPDLTAAAWADGWFKSGDIGRIDEQGNLFITGRIKDLIIRGGFNIAPVEIENVLHRMPGVKDAAVLGVEDELYGEKVIAVVTTLPGTVVSPDEVMAWCKAHLSAAKLPTTVWVTTDLPLNLSGKTDKRALKEQLLRNHVV